MLSLLFLTFSNTEARHRFDFLEGKFTSPQFGDQVRIKAIRGGIKVKGLNRTRGWLRFYTRRGSLLRPEYGRGMIEVVGPHRIILKRNRSSRGIHFVKKPRKGLVCNMSCCSSRWNQRDRNRYDRYDRRGYDDRFDYYDGYGQYDDYYYDDKLDRRNNRDRRSRDFSFNLEPYLGEWYSNELRKLVIIEKSGSNEIRARVSGSQRWTIYRLNGRQWEDDRGNTYTLESNDVLVWRKRNGKEVLRLFRS